MTPLDLILLYLSLQKQAAAIDYFTLYMPFPNIFWFEIDLI